eukprot:SAG22_NODE_6887_length_798_cov_1.935622_3_plen_106_part_01
MGPLPPWIAQDGDTIHRGNYRDFKERLTLHNGWSSRAPPAAAGDGGQALRHKKKSVCDARFLHWTHPGTREFLDSIGGTAVKGVLARAWDNYMSVRITPPKVAAWN